jgi:predicted dehydrogenase
VHLDFMERPPNHQLTVFGTVGSITWSHTDSAARRYHGVTRRWETVPAPDGFERERMFLDEMQHFLACLRGEAQPLCTIADGRAALKVTLAAKQAVAEARLSALAS